MRCPHCQSEQTVKNGTVKMQDQSFQQRYLCQSCGKRFNQRTNTAMARLRTSSTVVSAAINVRTEGLGVRATGRSFGKSHSTIIRWEGRLATQASQWSPVAPDGADVTLEGDEVYTRVGENLPPL
jgi:transposase-like protein